MEASDQSQIWCRGGGSFFLIYFSLLIKKNKDSTSFSKPSIGKPRHLLKEIKFLNDRLMRFSSTQHSSHPSSPS